MDAPALAHPSLSLVLICHARSCLSASLVGFPARLGSHCCLGASLVHSEGQQLTQGVVMSLCGSQVPSRDLCVSWLLAVPHRVLTGSCIVWVLIGVCTRSHFRVQVAGGGLSSEQVGYVENCWSRVSVVLSPLTHTVFLAQGCDVAHPVLPRPVSGLGPSWQKQRSCAAGNAIN